jgi:hypothetical protein
MTAPDPLPAPASPRRTRRWSPSFARMLARLLRSANVLTSILLGIVSLLIAFSAWQSSQWSDEANYYDSLANRMSSDAIQETQEAYAESVSDSAVWVQITVSGLSLDESPLTGLLSERWLDAARRFEAQGYGTDVMPIDARYLAELGVTAEGYSERIKDVYDKARNAGSISSRLTGASVIYSAALLLLTVASTTESRGRKLGLNTVAAVIMVVALLIGFAPIR